MPMVVDGGDFWLQQTAGYVPPVVPLLDESLRKEMHRISWIEVHQSDLSTGRRCPQHLYLGKLGKTKTFTVLGLLGSTFHKAFELRAETAMLGHLPAYWLNIMEEIMARSSVTYIVGGRVVHHDDLVEFAKLFASPETWGRKASELIEDIYNQLDQFGMQVVEVECNLSFTDAVGLKYPIVFDGTLDVLAKKGPYWIILDIKTSGLWDPFLIAVSQSKNGSATIKKQSWGMPAVQMHPQLRHYEWMLKRVRKIDVQFYGLIFPANRIPYKTGSDKGQPRGPAAEISPVLNAQLAAHYERDLLATIRGWIEGGFYRAQPTDFGKPSCPSCPVFQACMADSTSDLATDPTFRDFASKLYGG